MAKGKRMTNKEKRERAALKKHMQEEGLIPPDKPKLNRKKFIKEAEAEWNERDEECLIWGLYLMEAAFCMLGHKSMKGRGVSPEAVGAAKVLKLAVRFRKFDMELKEKGRHQYSGNEWYNYIKDIIDA